MKNIIIYILLINYLLPNAGGANSWSVFNVSSNASDFGLSRANISEGTKGFYQFSNPALLPQSEGISLGMSYTMMSLDRSSQVISFNMPLPPKAAIGLSIMRSGTSNIQGKDGVNNKTDIISDYEMLGIISFGVSFGKNISTGVNIKASYANLDNVISGANEPGYSISSKGIGFDWGILFRNNIGAIGFKIENMESSKNWNYRQDEETIPVIYKLGGHYKILDSFVIYACRDYELVDSDNPYYNELNRFGIRINNTNNKISGTLGVSQSENELLPAVGFYYKTRLFQLSYGVNFGSVNEGISHIFSWTFMK